MTLVDQDGELEESGIVGCASAARMVPPLNITPVSMSMANVDAEVLAGAMRKCPFKQTRAFLSPGSM